MTRHRADGRRSAPDRSMRRRRRRRPRRAATLRYALFLVPGALAFLVVIVVPFLMNIGISFTDWQGVGTPQWVGLDNYRELLDDAHFWASFRHNLAMVVAMAVVPTVARPGPGRRAVRLRRQALRHRVRRRVLRACFYLPQVLPIAVAGIVWSWILRPRQRRAQRTAGGGRARLAARRTGSATRTSRCYSVMGVMVWVQIGFPLVVFMAGLQRVDPALYEAAELDGAGWWRRFWHITLPADPPGDLRRAADVHHRRAQGVRRRSTC